MSHFCWLNFSRDFEDERTLELLVVVGRFPPQPENHHDQNNMESMYTIVLPVYL